MLALFRPISGLFDRVKEKPLLPNPDLAKALGACGLGLIAMLLIATSAILARIEVGRRPPPQVYLVQPKMAAKAVPTLPTPSISPTKVQRWTTRTLRQIFSFNFNNFDEHMAQSQVFFTDLGFVAFQDGLVKSKVADRVRESSLDVFLVPVAPARVINAKIISGVVAYTVQMPVLMVYRSASTTKTSSMLAIVIVRQVPTYENPDGVGIADIVLRPSR
jgi:hypothetical protein